MESDRSGFEFWVWHSLAKGFMLNHLTTLSLCILLSKNRTSNGAPPRTIVNLEGDDLFVHTAAGHHA